MKTPITDRFSAAAINFVRNAKVIHASHAQKLELDRDALMEALEQITEMAERVDSWESFPSGPIDKAYSALAAARANFPTP